MGVMAIIGLLMVAAFPNLRNFLSKFEQQVALRQVRAQILMAQRLAMAKGTSTQVDFINFGAHQGQVWIREQLPGGSSYSVISRKPLSGWDFVGHTQFYFSDTGFSPPAGFGTLLLSKSNNQHKLVMNQLGRITID